MLSVQSINGVPAKIYPAFRIKVFKTKKNFYMILTLILVPKAKFFRSAMWDFAQKVEQVNAVSFILNCIYIFPLTVHNNVALYLRNFRTVMQFYHLFVTHTRLIYGDYPVVGYTVLCCNINHLIYYSSYYLQSGIKLRRLLFTFQ